MNPWARVTFADRWTAAVHARAGHPFLRFEAADGAVTEWTYGEFDDVVHRVAGGLADAGVVPGRAVSLALANSPAFVAVWLAAARLGAWIVPSDPQSAAPELLGHLTRTKAALGICAPARAATYREAAVAAGVPVVEVHEADVDLAVFGTRRLASDGPRPRARDRAAVMFTSGTTSAPKGVEVSQAGYAFAGEVMAAAAGLGADDRQIVVLPLFHANAQYYSFAAAIAVGASVALMSSFSASGFLAQCARHGATHASLFAAPMRMILARGGDPTPDVAAALRLRHCWYAQNVTTDQYDELTRLLGCRPRQLYGMTETLPAVLTNRAVDPLPHAMGTVTLGCEVEVHDADGRACGPGEVGEVVVSGIPGLTLFAGYLDDAVTTAASFDGRWFLTGDRAHVDDDGRFFFDGRRSDVLKVAGENVSVVEVEAVLAEHPGVLEAAVVGEPDPVRDEVPIAFVVAVSAADGIDVRALEAHCAARLAPAKRPRRITVVDELPRTSVGKIRKFLLKDGR
jgi:carnitine-CoA ligase